MANHYYGITVPGANQTVGGVTVGTSTTGKNVELVLLDGVSGNSKEEVLAAVEALYNYIATDAAPA